MCLKQAPWEKLVVIVCLAYRRVIWGECDLCSNEVSCIVDEWVEKSIRVWFESSVRYWSGTSNGKCLRIPRRRKQSTDHPTCRFTPSGDRDFSEDRRALHCSRYWTLSPEPERQSFYTKSIGSHPSSSQRTPRIRWLWTWLLCDAPNKLSFIHVNFPMILRTRDSYRIKRKQHSCCDAYHKTCLADARRYSSICLHFFFSSVLFTHRAFFREPTEYNHTLPSWNS